MTSGNDARHWRETAQHLVQAHGALPGALTSYAPRAGAAPLRTCRYARSSRRQRCGGTRWPHPHRAIGPGVPLRPGLLVPSVPARTDRELWRSYGAYFGWETCLPQTMWETGVPRPIRRFEASLREADPDGPELEAGQ